MRSHTIIKDSLEHDLDCFFNFSNFLLNCLYTLSSFNMCIWNVFCPLQYAHVPYLVPKTLVWRYRRTAALKVVYWAVWKVRQWDLPPIAWRPLYNSCLLLSVRAVRAYIYVQAYDIYIGIGARLSRYVKWLITRSRLVHDNDVITTRFMI